MGRVDNDERLETSSKRTKKDFNITLISRRVDRSFQDTIKNDFNLSLFHLFSSQVT